jgi:4-hydroxyacetophenone monooxygenase
MSTQPHPAADSREVFDDLYWQDEYEAITEDDAFLAGIVAKADLPSLLAAVAAATGDTSILSEDLRPPLVPVDTIGLPHTGMSEEAQRRAREVALDALKRIRDERLTSVAQLPDEQVRDLLTFLSNGNDSPEWLGLLTHELDLARNKGGAPEWSFAEAAKGRDFSVLIVGAALSGIAAGHRLTQAGIPFTIIEASHRVGGTWWKNHYPGVRLDTPTYGYSYSFAQRPDWPHQFAEGHEVREYLESVAELAGLPDRIEFETALIRAVWNEESGTWSATTRAGDGRTQTREFNAIITGIGQLDHPFIPEFPGQEEFAGAQMHSQEWDHSVETRGKRVAVVGTGASAYQIVPALVDEVESMHVFQRSAPWMLPAPTYHDETTETFRWLVRKVPYYGQWFRLWVTLLGIDGRIHTVTAEEDWEGAPLSVSPTNQKVRDEIIGMLGEQLRDHPEMLERMTPHYPPGAKRMLRDNGVWADALTRPQTTLVSSGIDRFTETGVVTTDGTEIELDVVVYATGFRPSDYLDPIEIVGRGGVEIHDYWGGDAKGFGGITVPGYPNLFMLLGPNTGGVVAGGLYFMIERAAEYAIKAIRLLLEEDAKALDLTQEALDEHMAWVDAENSRMAWGQPYVRTWYQNSTGRVSQVWPFPITDYWRITEEVDRGGYDLLR